MANRRISAAMKLPRPAPRAPRNASILLRLCCHVMLIATGAGALPAADRVTLRTTAGSLTTRSGTVVDYSASELRLQPAAGGEVSIAADQVVRIETARTAAHAQAEALLAKKAWPEAAERLADAIRGEPRPWVRREMLAQMVRCYRALGDGDAAGKVFLQLAQGNPPAAEFAVIPLAWQAIDPLVVSPRQARAWLEAAGDSAANLLGASHLLNTAEAADAMAVLERLTSDRDVRIALLAEAQRWRTKRAGLDAAELARRRDVVGKIDVPLRGGPYFALGQSQLAAGQTDDAVATLLRLPIGYAQERTLCAAAIADAAEALRAAGRREEADALSRELQRDYADLAGAGKANRLRALTPTQRPGD